MVRPALAAMLPPRPRIAVIGTGALGGYYGGLLARAGHDVHFLVRSDLAHVQARGLRIDSVDGDFVLPRVQAHGTAASVPPCDLALVCLKATQNAVLGDVLPALLVDGGSVVLLQNGLGEEERLADLARVGSVVSALGFVCATKTAPGHVRHLDYGALRLAEYGPGRTAAGLTPHLEAVGALFTGAGVKVTLAEDWLEARWKKLVWNVPFNGLTVVLRADTGELVGHAPTRALVRSIMLEVTAAAAAEGRSIGEEFVDRMLADTAAMRPYLPSMRVDYDAGRPLETHTMYRVPLARGAAGGVEMVRTEMLAAELELVAESRDRHPQEDPAP